MGFFFFFLRAQQFQQTTKDFKTKKQTKKVCSVWKCEADGIIYFCSSSVFIMGAHFETHDAPAITVTAYYNAPWHYKCLSLQQCFTAICVYAYLTVQLSLVSKGRLKLTFHFRYCGTIKDSMFKKKKRKKKGHCVLRTDCFHLLGLSGLECGVFFFGFFGLLPLSWKDLGASHHCTCTAMLPILRFFFFFYF